MSAIAELNNLAAEGLADPRTNAGDWDFDFGKIAGRITRPVDLMLTGKPHAALVQNGWKHHERVQPMAQVVWSGNPRAVRVNYQGERGLTPSQLAQRWAGVPAYLRGVWLGTDHFLRELGPDQKTPRKWTADLYPGTDTYSLWSDRWAVWAGGQWGEFCAALYAAGLGRPEEQTAIVRVVDDEWTARRHEIVNEKEWGADAWPRLRGDGRTARVLDWIGLTTEAERANFLSEFPRLRMESDARHWRWVAATQEIHAAAWRQTSGVNRSGVVNFHGVAQWVFPCGRAEVPWLSPGGSGCAAGTHQVVKLYPDTPANKRFDPEAAANVTYEDSEFARLCVQLQTIAGAMASNPAKLWVVIQSQGKPITDLVREGWIHAALRSGEPLLVSQEGDLTSDQQRALAEALGETLAELDAATGGYGYRPLVPAPWDGAIDKTETSVVLPSGKTITRETKADGSGRWV